MLRSVDDVLSEIRRAQGLEAGSIRIGAGPVRAGAVRRRGGVPGGRRYPGLHLRVVQGGWEALTDDVASGALDVAVAEVAAAEQEPNLSVERHRRPRWLVLLPRAAPAALAKSRSTFEDVSAFPLAMSPLPGRVAPFFERKGAAGRVDPDLRPLPPGVDRGRGGTHEARRPRDGRRELGARAS